MKLPRPRILVILAVAAGLVVVLARGGGQNTGPGDQARDTTDSVPELLQRLRSFHRVVTRHGEKLLEISADEASYYRNDRAVIVKAPHLRFFDKGEDAGSLSGREGRVYLDGHEVESVELFGDVRLDLGDFTLSTEALTYERKRHLLMTSGAATIRSAEVTLSANALAIDLEARTLRLEGGVEMSLIAAPSTPVAAIADTATADKNSRPQLKARAGALFATVASLTRQFTLSGLDHDLRVSAERLDYDHLNQRLVYSGAVSVVHGPAQLEADEMILELDNDKLSGLTASGNVRLRRGSEIVEAGHALYQPADRRIVLSRGIRLGSGPNSVSGERVVVFLDDGKTVVQGGQQPVRALIEPRSLGTLQ
ncbi:MAG: LPS export ABC transporter periplasmic protein LptC [Deltaproteobacteria bacterium]